MLFLALFAQVELLDLADRIDDVDASTREVIDAALDRGHAALDLPLITGDRALPIQSRDDAVSLIVSYAWRASAVREAFALWVRLSVDLDRLLFRPRSLGPPPDERRRLTRCAEAISDPSPVGRARVAALRCAS